MPIAVIADIHLGVHKQFDHNGSRLREIKTAVKKCFHKASELADVLVIAGDFLDKRKSVDTEVLSTAVRLMRVASNKFKYVYILEGNHEYLSPHHSVLEALELLENVHLVKGYVKRLHHNGFNIDLVPHGVDFPNGNGLPILGVAVAIGHVMVTGATVNTDDPHVLQDGVPPETFAGYKTVVLGDIHKRQVIRYKNTRIYYVGTPIQHNFGECGYPTGFAIINEKDASVKFHNVLSRKFVKIDFTANTSADLSSLDPKNFYWFACAHAGHQAELLRVLDERYSATVTVKPRERNEVRLESVKSKKKLSVIAEEYLTRIRTDLEPEMVKDVLRMFKARLSNAARA